MTSFLMCAYLLSKISFLILFVLQVLRLIKDNFYELPAGRIEAAINSAMIVGLITAILLAILYFPWLWRYEMKGWWGMNERRGERE